MWEGQERELGRRGARVGEKTPPLGCPWATMESEWGGRQRKEGSKVWGKDLPCLRPELGKVRVRERALPGGEAREGRQGEQGRGRRGRTT